MTREEAIKYLSEEQKKTEEVVALTERDFGVLESVWHTEYEAFNLAISALREQLLETEKQATETSDNKASEGCEYCTDSKNIYEIKSPLHDSYNTDVYISEDALIVDIGCHSYGASKIKFCPMCGRRLEESNGS